MESFHGLFLIIDKTSLRKCILTYQLQTSIDRGKNFTLHCTTSTTRGYFELRNWHNDLQYGPLKKSWPTLEELKQEYNDYRGVTAYYARPLEQLVKASSTVFRLLTANRDAKDDSINLLTWDEPLGRFDTRSLKASGPLMTSAIAIFGNGSFFHTAFLADNDTFPIAASQICRQNAIPFTRLGHPFFNEVQPYCSGQNLDWSTRDPSRADSYLIRIMDRWSSQWYWPEGAEEALSMSTFAANKAVLIKTGEASRLSEARPIYTSPGIIVPRPVLTLASTIILSVLIFLQLSGIAYTTWYIYRVPSWSHALDAVAMVRLSAGLREAGYKLPPIRDLEEKYLKGLVDIDGLVGVENIEDVELQTKGCEHLKLVLGGPGLIPKRLPRKREDKIRFSKWKRYLPWISNK